MLEKWDGQFSMQDLMQMDPSLREGLSFDRPIRVLVYAVSARFDVTDDGLVEYAGAFEDLISDPSLLSLALFVAPEQLGDAKFLAGQFRSMGGRCMAFSSVTVACAWLGVELAHAMDVLRTMLFGEELNALVDRSGGPNASDTA